MRQICGWISSGDLLQVLAPELVKLQEVGRQANEEADRFAAKAEDAR